VKTVRNGKDSLGKHDIVELRHFEPGILLFVV